MNVCACLMNRSSTNNGKRIHDLYEQDRSSYPVNDRSKGNVLRRSLLVLHFERVLLILFWWQCLLSWIGNCDNGGGFVTIRSRWEAIVSYTFPWKQRYSNIEIVRALFCTLLCGFGPVIHGTRIVRHSHSMGLHFSFPYSSWLRLLQYYHKRRLQ